MNKWYKHFTIFVDPLLKTKDQSLYQVILNRLQKTNFNLLFQNTSLSQDKLSKDTLVVSISNQEFSPCYYFSYKEKNMTLFNDESKNSQEPRAVFSSMDEFEIGFKQYCQVVDHEISSIEKNLFKIHLKKFKNLTTLKSLDEMKLTSKMKKIANDFEIEIHKIISEDSLFFFFEEYTKKNQKVQGDDFDIEICLKHPSDTDLSEELTFPLDFKNSLFFLSFKNCPKELAVDMYSSCISAMNRIHIKDEKSNLFKKIDDVFSTLDIPLAVFDLDQNLTLHNDLFIKLNLSAKECFNFKINEQITIDNNVFKVQKILDNAKNSLHLNFIPVNEVLGSSSSPTSEELGIVSSSIAHELNNPLAGVLAALNVLELDDYSEEIINKFDQMKQSVNRCKKLVETFLGFSRVNKKGQGLTSYGKDSFLQAMELMRFRLIENNITIAFDYKQKEKLSYPVNSHVLSMIFYLFLGELLTSFSHQNLVELNNAKKINLNVLEDFNGVFLEFNQGIALSDNLIKSRLIEHLIEGEKLELNAKPGLISLTYKDEDGK